MVCYDWYTDSIVHEWDPPGMKGSVESSLSSVAVDLPLKDFGPSKFEAEPVAARCCVMGTDKGSVYVVKLPNTGN